MCFHDCFTAFSFSLSRPLRGTVVPYNGKSLSLADRTIGIIIIYIAVKVAAVAGDAPLLRNDCYLPAAVAASSEQGCGAGSALLGPAAL